MRRILLVAACTATISVLAACSRTPITLDLQYYPLIEGQQAPRGTCRVTVEPVVDCRSNTASLGMLGGRVVWGKNVTGWVTEGLGTVFSPPGFAPAESAAAADVVTKVELEKAYVQYVLSNFETVVTLRSTLFLRDGTSRTLIHRGSDVKANWFGGDGEIMYSLNSSLSKALASLTKDVADACDVRSGR